MANKDMSIRKNDQTPATNLMPEFDRMFDNMVERFFGTKLNSWMGDMPQLNRRAVSNIQEKDDCYFLTAEIPGVPQEDINISVNGNTLTIQAEHKEESGSEDSEQGFKRQYRSFQKTMTLPSSVDVSKIEANYQNGLLEIMLPKSEEAQPKKIEVQSNKSSWQNQIAGKPGNKKTDDTKSADTKH